MDANDKQQSLKPGDDERTLPPLLPVYAATRKPDDDPKINRMLELPLVAHSVMVYGKEHNLSDRQRRNLVSAFTCECADVQELVERNLLKLRIPDQCRFDHHKQFQNLSLRLTDEVENSLRSQTVDLDQVIRLHRQYMAMLGQSTFFLRVEVARQRLETVQGIIDSVLRPRKAISSEIGHV